MDLLGITQIVVVLVALAASAFSFRSRINTNITDAQDKSVHALQDAVQALEIKVRHQQEEHLAELIARDARIEALENEVKALREFVGPVALSELKDHVDNAAKTIVDALSNR